MIIGGRSVEWVKRLPFVLKAMNNEAAKITRKELTEIKNNKPNYKRVVGYDEVRLPPGVVDKRRYSRDFHFPLRIKAKISEYAPILTFSNYA